jgi:hypothetical protein
MMALLLVPPNRTPDAGLLSAARVAPQPAPVLGDYGPNTIHAGALPNYNPPTVRPPSRLPAVPHGITTGYTTRPSAGVGPRFAASPSSGPAADYYDPSSPNFGAGYPAVNTAFDPYSGYDSGGFGGFGSYDLNSDPSVVAARQAENLGLTQLDANLAEARRQAIIRFGDPTLATEAGFGLDPQAATFAQQNYLSGNADLAQLDKQHKEMRDAVIAKLASHGILASGDLGYQEGQADQTYGHNVYDARSKVLDYLRGLNETYLDRRNSLRQATVQALQSAYQFGLSNPYLYGAGGGGAGGGGGAAGGGGGGGGGGPVENPTQFKTGFSPSQIQSSAARYAQGRTYNGHPYVPHMVMQEGHIEVRNGVPGIYIKYMTGEGASTEWTPIG